MKKEERVRGQKGRPQLGKLYNKFEGLKESFIQSVMLNEENTAKTYRRVLEKASKLEEEWDKDICEFSYDELDKLLGFLDAGSINSVQVQHSVLRQYIRFADEHHYANPLTLSYIDMFKVEDFNKYVNKIRTKKQILDIEDILDIAEEVDKVEGNMQDVCPIVLIFSGAWGTNLEELINFKKDDLDEENYKIKLTTDKGNERTIDVDPELFRIIVDASNEVEYVKGNGQNLEKMKFTHFELLDTPYVLKNVKRRDTQIKISPQSVRQRIDKIKKFWGNEYINPTSILKSGMIAYARKYMEENNLEKLQTEDYQHIAERFGKNRSTYFFVKRDIEEYLK